MGGVKAPVDNYTAEDDRCVERHETSTVAQHKPGSPTGDAYAEHSSVLMLVVVLVDTGVI